MTNVINKAITEFEVLSSFPQYDFDYVDLIKELKAYKEALEQPAQEPVAWMHRHDSEITEFNDFQSCDKCEPLYTHPTPSWQKLSDDEIDDFITKFIGSNQKTKEFIRAIEQALKEKNHG
jgi:IS30 family transposase